MVSRLLKKNFPNDSLPWRRLLLSRERQFVEYYNRRTPPLPLDTIASRWAAAKRFLTDHNTGALQSVEGLEIPEPSEELWPTGVGTCTTFALAASASMGARFAFGDFGPHRAALKAQGDKAVVLDSSARIAFELGRGTSMQLAKHTWSLDMNMRLSWVLHGSNTLECIMQVLETPTGRATLRGGISG